MAKRGIYTMVNVAIVENKADYANELETLLLQWAYQKVELKIAKFLDCSEFLHQWEKGLLRVDIVFIDLVQDRFDGITVGTRLRELGYKNTIILISETENRVLDGYKLRAYRYCLRPLQQYDVDECMNHVWNKKAGEYFRYTYHGVSGRIPFTEIVCFESMQHYVDIFTTDKEIHIKESLKAIQPLCPSYFVRCQRSYIVNVRYIEERQGNKLRLSNQKMIEISSKYIETVLNTMKADHMGSDIF